MLPDRLGLAESYFGHPSELQPRTHPQLPRIDRVNKLDCASAVKAIQKLAARVAPGARHQPSTTKRERGTPAAAQSRSQQPSSGVKILIIEVVKLARIPLQFVNLLIRPKWRERTLIEVVQRKRCLSHR